MTVQVADWHGFAMDYSVENGARNILRTRRQSNVNVDAIHEPPVDDSEMAPAQLYATESGRLFHSGKIAIVTVGLPARGKTHVTVALSRYLRWLGVKTRAFHLGDYRRAHLGHGKDVPHDYFHVNASAESVKLRQTILQKCRLDLYHFLDYEKGQVAIYDAVNPLAEGRRQLAREFAKHDIQTIFIESFVDDQSIIEENVRSVKISSPDYAGWNADEAVSHYIQRMNAKIPHFETMAEKDLNYIKMINAGKRYEVNNCRFGYLPNRIVFYLMNLHIKSRKTYFARAGISGNTSYKADGPLSEAGVEYSKRLADTLMAHREQEHQQFIAQGGSETEVRNLTVWTSTRRRTVQTTEPLQALGFAVREKTQLSQLNPGDSEKLTDDELRKTFPDHWEEHQLDSYHHRYPRGESYHDLAVRMEPVILELEREKQDLLIIAHESVLRVLYGYLMACSTQDIPSLIFPRNEIVEIIPESYNNKSKRIKIPHTNAKGEYVP
ncbi:bifunctional 6-phosphofructo-2-kinase/fructose-2,6-bisphosphate 2-phosphatase [Wilcoxina mikolae CBS 423.85]|nr:bifunctional 6-phosphofructo-2-kinase/fructose-2,6-bisphosphate 2-phosphatase [Wilcoxina mikolae CBS 423.85]